jgi:putative redox protein
MAEQLTRVLVAETGASAYAVSITASGHQINGDEPVEAGGGNLGPAPYDLLAAALGECTAMTIRWYALQHKWPLDHIEVTLTHRKGGDGAVSARQDVFEKRIRLTGPDLTAEQHSKLLDIAARCPVQRTLEGTPLIRTSQA